MLGRGGVTNPYVVGHSPHKPHGPAAARTAVAEGTWSKTVVEVAGNWMYYRPKPEESLMSLAVATAARSNCRKRAVGAIITSERRIIAAGYDGTIMGFTNCIDGGCPRCNSNAESGTRLDECICVHAEQNALLSAAQLNNGVKGRQGWGMLGND